MRIRSRKKLSRTAHWEGKDDDSDSRGEEVMANDQWPTKSQAANDQFVMSTFGLWFLDLVLCWPLVIGYVPRGVSRSMTRPRSPQAGGRNGMAGSS